MKLAVIVRKAEEGGYLAEAPAIPGCATERCLMDLAWRPETES